MAQPLLSHILLGAVRATKSHGFGCSSLDLLRGSFLSPCRRDNVESGVTTGGKEEAVTSNGHEGTYASTANDFRSKESTHAYENTLELEERVVTTAM